MATTTNYGWVTPDDTALVKDGAAAIRTLGSSVDTTTKNLNPSTTLGDIEYRSSTANTNTRLGIGTTGQVLLVSGGVPAWGTVPSSAGITLIDEVAFSASTAVNVDNVFSATYKCYRIVVTCVSDGASASLLGIRLRVGGTDTTTNYSAQRLYTSGSTVNTDPNPLGADEWMVGTGTTSSEGVAGCSFDLFNPYLTTYTSYNGANSFATGASTGEVFISGGSLRDSTSYTGFTLKLGNASTGSIFVYGYAKE
jgi:hypothetical protein